MSDNPIHALRAVLTANIDIDGIEIHPVNIARYSILDAIESPIVGGSES